MRGSMVSGASLIRTEGRTASAVQNFGQEKSYRSNSPTARNACVRSSVPIRKSAFDSRSSSVAASEDKKPFSLAAMSAPTRPIIGTPSRRATARPFCSLISKTLALISFARTIASASPWLSSRSSRAAPSRSWIGTVSIKPARALWWKRNSRSTDGGIKIAPYNWRRTAMRSIWMSEVIAEVSLTTIIYSSARDVTLQSFEGHAEGLRFRSSRKSCACRVHVKSLSAKYPQDRHLVRASRLRLHKVRSPSPVLHAAESTRPRTLFCRANRLSHFQITHLSAADKHVYL